MYRTQELEDREQYDAWVAGQLERFTAEGQDVWDTAKLARAGMAAKHDSEAYRGPWRNVRPYVTEEFRLWVEDQKDQDRHVRWTFQEWQAAMRAERSRERSAAQDPENLLGALEYMRDLMSRRGDMIADLRDAGIGWAAICEASGLSRMQAHTLAKAARTPF